MRTKPEEAAKLLVGHSIVALMSSLHIMSNTKLFRFIDSHREAFPVFTAVLLGTAIGFASCIALNKVINARVKATCDLRLHQVVSIRTVVGETHYCVSKMVLFGPPAPIKD